LCTFEDPPRGGLSSSWDIHGSKGHIIGNEIFIGAAEHRLHFPIRHEYTEVEGERILDCVRVDTDPPIVFENPFKQFRANNDDEVARMQLLVGFHKAVTEGCEPRYGAMNARRDIEILLAMRESARRGNSWVELPLREVTDLERRLHEEFVKLYGHPYEEFDRLVNVPFPRGGVRWKVAGWD